MCCELLRLNSNKQLDFLAVKSGLLGFTMHFLYAIYFFCGEEEYIYDNNRLMHDAFCWVSVIHTQDIQFAVKY